MNPSLHKLSNLGLSRPQVPIFHKVWSSYHVCGCIGFALAVLLGIVLVVHQDLSLWVLAAIAPTAAAIFFGLAMVTKIVTGKEKLIYYHHEIAIMLAVAVLVWLLQAPVLRYLDITILGIGLFLVLGRIGCLMVGCCHGRPHSWGICYRHEHARAGFPHYLVGVRLFPIQAVESLFVLGVVLGGVWMVVTDHPPGDALAWYVVTYGVARFFFEFFRGDVGRAEVLGFSEAQWTSVYLMSAGAIAEWFGLLTLHPLHAMATVALVLTIPIVWVRRHLDPTRQHRLLHPRHVKELANAVEVAASQALESPGISTRVDHPAAVQLKHTSLGVNISSSHLHDGTGEVEHYTLSSRSEPLTKDIATNLAKLILRLKHTSTPHELIQGAGGVFHLLVHR